MTLAFTLCSVNYLAQARTLGDSLAQTNPDWRYVIGLVDDLAAANLPPDLLPPYELLEVSRIGIPDFEGMGRRYDITELNTAVKPFFMEYFFREVPNAERVIYFDPDIIVFQPLERLSRHLDTYSLVLTPHITQPTPDWERPNDQHHLGTGIFNLGFIGLRRDDTARTFVRWWMDRLEFECKIDLCNGLFVDQHWCNFAPVYHDNVLIEKHPGYNVAYWNLHERQATQTETATWLMNDEPLQFFHYSGYAPERPADISKYQTRYTFAQRPDMVPLFQYYHQQLLTNHHERYRTYPCVYLKPQKVLRYKRVRRAVASPFRWLLGALEK